MVTPTTAPELAEPHLRGLLASIGLDVEYVRGSGDTLYYRDTDGVEIPVLDLVGGYGSLIFGHNHPRLVERARELLEQQVPVHAQFSYHPYANELAHELNTVLRRELGVDEPYHALFGNSGAEAVEIAMKHAELDRVVRVGALRARVAEAWAAVQAAAPAVPADVTERLELPGTATLDDVVAAAARMNEESFTRAPVFLALEGGFHGKLAGSVQLTHNPGYRMPFSALAAQARFVPAAPGAVAEAADAERAEVLVPEVVDGVLRLAVERSPVVAALFVEPVQGEGGIRVLDRAVAAEIRSVADDAGFPVVVDEVQSGMGRTGRFFAAAHSGLAGDYVLLAKGIGGGVAKSSVTLIRGSRYQGDFELVHSSTFAKDAFSVHIGLEVLRMLEEDGGAAYARAAERGAALRAELEAVRAEFPDVVSDVRGEGLMLGVEFADLTASPDPVLAENAAHGLIGYVLAGHLLRRHAVRVFPTASAPHTLRAEPSIGLTDEAIAQFGSALRELCGLLRKGDGSTLLPT